MLIERDVQIIANLVMALLSATLAFALACSIRSLAGKGWLVAFTALALVYRPLSYVVQMLGRRTFVGPQAYEWYDVVNLFPVLSAACFALFLLANWSRTRMNLSTGHLLFSFSGRIPRSAFWITLLILVPVGTLIGIAPLASTANVVVKVILWSVYALWALLSIWITLAVYAKRWHDCGLSGWMSLLLLVPVLGPLFILCYLGFVPGKPGANKYGDNPLL